MIPTDPFANLDERSYQLIIDLVMSDGGDGWGTLVVNDDTFDKHVEKFSQMERVKKWYMRRDRNTDVLFEDGQEFISIVKASDFKYSVAERIDGAYIVKIV